MARLGNRMLLSYPHTTLFAWNSPTRLLIGPGRIAAVAEEILRLGGRRVFLIGDPGIESAGLLDRMKGALGSFLQAVFTDVPPDSSMETVDRAVAAGRKAVWTPS